MAYGYSKKEKHISPCYQCTERYVDEHFNCHNTCEKYTTWKFKLAHDNAQLKKQINPAGSRYFKTKTSVMAPKSKAKYR